jgi:hypothetical protein
LLRDSGFRVHREMLERREESDTIWREVKQSSDLPAEKRLREYRQILIDTIPRLRNELAHGSTAVMMPTQVLRFLGTAADLINQLFEQ